MTDKLINTCREDAACPAAAELMASIAALPGSKRVITRSGTSRREDLFAGAAGSCSSDRALLDAISAAAVRGGTVIVFEDRVAAALDENGLLPIQKLVYVAVLGNGKWLALPPTLIGSRDGSHRLEESLPQGYRPAQLERTLLRPLAPLAG